jgi:hypothetical protein
MLRLLGPLVVASTLALLATGLALLVMGSDSFSPLTGSTALSMASLHKASYLVWFVLMTLHVLARTVPALRLIGSRAARDHRVPGGVERLGVILVTTASGMVAGSVLLAAASWWTTTWTR